MLYTELHVCTTGVFVQWDTKPQTLIPNCHLLAKCGRFYTKNEIHLKSAKSIYLNSAKSGLLAQNEHCFRVLISVKNCIIVP